VTWNQEIAEFPGLRAGIAYLPLPIGGLITLLFIIERSVAGSQAQRPAVRLQEPKSAD
jgi:TRAP-type C4-dicarboxylate transport system permease small subunit